MTYQARVVRILIASPSDVGEERELVVRAIQEWNDLYSVERRLVLLPLRWETHASPQYGERPQEIINREVVDHCDLMIGIFWTRIGSSTGAAESGTLEEVERVAASGKPVMLYFSRSLIDPDKVDLDQLTRLREFKEGIRRNALIESYSNQVDFKDKLAKQLEIRIREMLASAEGDENSVGHTVPDILFHLANSESGNDYGSEIKVASTLIKIPDFESIPDYLPEGGGKTSNSTQDSYLSILGHNKNYYRDWAAFVSKLSWFRPVRFWLKNAGSIGARDIYIEVTLRCEDGELAVLAASDLPAHPPTKSGIDITSRSFSLHGDMRQSPPLKEVDGGWFTYLEIPALQPQREMSPEPTLLLAAKEDCEVTVTARVFADILSQPIVKTASIHLKVKTITIPAADLLQSLESRPVETSSLPVTFGGEEVVEASNR